MPYDTDTRDRLAAYPLKGTKAKLLRKMRRMGYTSLGSYLNAIIEKEANAKRINNEEGA